MTIEGARFGGNPHVLINGTDQADYVKFALDTMIMLKAKAKKLGLKAGDNTVQVTDMMGNASNVFILTF